MDWQREWYKLTEGAMEVKLARFLFFYRVTPHSTTGMSPAELMFGQQLRTRFDILLPGLANRVCKKQEKQKKGFDMHTIEIGSSLKVIMFMLNFRDNSTKWLPGKIVKQIGNVSIIVRLEDIDVCVKRHQNQLLIRRTTRILELETYFKPTQPQVDTTVTETNTQPQYPTRIHRARRCSLKKLELINMKGERDACIM